MRNFRALSCAIAISLMMVAAAPANPPVSTVDALPGNARVHPARRTRRTRGAVHAFANESGAPAVADAIYAPPFGGADRVEAPQTSSR